MPWKRRGTDLRKTGQRFSLSPGERAGVRASVGATMGGGCLPEDDTLCQGEIAGMVDGGGLAAHVVFPCVAAAFPAAAGFLFAAERTADLRAAGADIDVGDAAVAA